MSRVIVVGDGPAGLSAALFLAKNDKEVVVFGKDETAMHYALLYNYLGIPKMTGTEFQKIAREQVTSFGAEIQDAKVSEIVKEGDSFTVKTEDGESHSAQYIILAEGRGLDVAQTLGLEKTSEGLMVDRVGRTVVDDVYAVGRAANINRSQAIISAGDGAAAALDILSREAGKDIHDWDSPPKEE